MVQSEAMRARRRNVAPRREPPAARGFWAEALAVVILAFALVLVLSLASYRPDDPVPWPFGHWSGEPVQNAAGIIGAFLAELMRQLLGQAAWATTPLLVLLGWRLFWGHRERRLSHLAGYALLTVSGAACLHLLIDAGRPPSALHAGGFIGYASGRFLQGLFNRGGGLVVGLALFGASFLLVTRASFVEALRALSRRITSVAITSRA